jgi:EmrB/QacA subfamily drug resistance transporter
MERKWWTLLGVCMAMFMLLVDITIVQVALPSIQRDLHSDLTGLQWVIDAYAVTLAAVLLTAGALSDRFGRRTAFAVGVVVFAIASLLCGVAGSSLELILARGLQGFGGAAMFATALALIGQEFHGPERATAIAAWGATTGAGVASGPLLGGALTEGLGWRWIFLVNVPIALAAIAIAVRYMVDVRDPDAGRVDWLGFATFSGSLFLLILGLLRGNAEGWSSAPILAALIGAAALMVLFVAIERRGARPMLDLGLFRKPAFVGVSLAVFAIAAGMFAMLLFITLYLQNVLGYSPLQGGLRLLPQTMLVFFVPLAMARFARRLPAGPLIGGGLALVAVGLMLMRSVSATSDWTALLAGLMIAGLGIGLANPAIGATALAVVPPARSGMASGINNTCRIGGVAAGIAALGAVFEHELVSRFHELAPQAPAGLAHAISAGGMRALGATQRSFADASRQALVGSFRELLLIGAITVAGGALAALTLIRARHMRPAQAPSLEAAPDPSSA